MRKRLDILLHLLEVQRVQQYIPALSVGADGTRHPEQNDGEENEYAQHQTEGIEEVGI